MSQPKHPIPHYLADGSPTGAWCCAICRVVWPTIKHAELCRLYCRKPGWAETASADTKTVNAARAKARGQEGGAK